MHRAQSLVLAVSGFFAACAPPATPADDGAMSCEGGSSLQCVDGEPGGSCASTAVAPACLDGIWACPTGATERSTCACFNGAIASCEGSDGGLDAGG